MRLTGINDTDIRLDRYGQPVADSNGECMLVSGMDCWMQDIWVEMLSEEAELLWEDQEGMQAYGYGLREFLNAEQDDALREEISARVIGKLTKRDYINEGSIELFMMPALPGEWAVNVRFRESGGTDIKVDIQSDGKELYVT